MRPRRDAIHVRLSSLAVLLLAACGGKTEGATPFEAATSDDKGASSSTHVTGSCNGSWQTCVTSRGEDGVAACDATGTRSPCGPVDPSNGCHPGDRLLADDVPDCDTSCALDPSTGTWHYAACAESGSSSSGASPGGSASSGTPLVLAFDGEPVQFTRAAGAFNLAGREASVATDWVSSATPWLALDRNGNGSIDDGSELFGSMTELPDGQRAPNGFVALAALDEDGDGRITARDAAFDRLLVWRDTDQDRRSEPRELTSAAETGLVSIDLRYRVDARCDGDDCEIERARFVFRAGRDERTGCVVDVHLRLR